MQFSWTQILRRIGWATVVVLAIGLGSSSASAQPVDDSIRAYGFNIFLGTERFASVSLLNFEGEAITGWNYGVCLDETKLAVTDLQFPATGYTPEFSQFAIEPGGWTQNVIVSSLPGEGLPILGFQQPMALAYYEALVDSGQTTICPCSEVGSPPVMVELFTEFGSSTPTTICGDVSFFPQSEGSFDIVDRTVYYPVDQTDRSFSVDITQAELPSPSGSQGFSFGVLHDPDLLSIDTVYSVGQLTYLGHAAPFSGQFLQITYHPEGWTVGCVFGGFSDVEFGLEPEPIFRAVYNTAPTLDGTEIQTSLEFTPDLGVPPVAVVVVFNGASILPVLSNGELTLRPFDGDLFRRGDCNADGAVDIADGVSVLTELFDQGPSAPCAAACEINADGVYDLADPIYVFNYILLGGPPPSAPFEECGGADTSFSCDSYGACDSQ